MILTEADLFLIAVVAVLATLAAIANSAYQRRTALDETALRDFNRQISDRPWTSVPRGLGAGWQLLRNLFRRNPNRQLERLRVTAVVLQVATWVVGGVLILRWIGAI